MLFRMNSGTLITIGAGAALVVLVLLAKKLGQISEAEAQRLLQSGAKVVDVRSPEEFNSGHVKGAVNIPLGELGPRIGLVAPDKSAPLLVHCLSGGRSAIAKGALRRQGYTQVHNLGSLRRARQIIGA